MSKINALRLINLNYNNNAIRISDETFHLNGESTLLSLRNGGGKSVLVQMMMAPFVHKRYRDAKDRPFESYFTTGKPSFILVEWKLDQGAGFALTGMMVRRSQEAGEPTGENLEMINFISEYREPCLQDIHHLPVVEKGKKEIVLKNFAACRQLFEAYKKDRAVQFFYYDMGNGAQSRQYFDKLMEYQVNYKEWETIVKKVNLKESGLSDLFADCKDEKGLVEKWFLEAVESKLNKEKNRMKEFQTILGKYVGQYKDNQSKIKRRDTIRGFKEEAERIREKAGIYQEACAQEKSQENLIIHFIAELNRLREDASREQGAVLEDIETIREAVARVEYEKLSGEIHELESQKRYHSSDRDMIAMEQEGLETEAAAISKKLHLLDCARQQETNDGDREELELIRQRLLASRRKEEDLEPERKQLGYFLKCHYEEALRENHKSGEENSRECRRVFGEIRQEKEKLEDLRGRILEAAGRQGALRAKTEEYGFREESFNTRYGEALVRNILGEYEPGTMEIKQETYRIELEDSVKERTGRKRQLEASREELKQQERARDDLREEVIRKTAQREQQKKQKAGYEQELEERRTVLRYLDMEERDLFHTERILDTSAKKLLEIESLRRNLEKEEDELQKEHTRLTQGKVLELPEDFEGELKGLGIHVVFGMEWLKKNGNSEKKNRKLVQRHPFLPYALLLSRQELEKLAGHTGQLYTSFPIPIIVREQLEEESRAVSGGVLRYPGVSFYVLFNENLLDEEKLAALVWDKARQIEKKQEALAIRQTEYREYFERQELIKNQTVTRELYEELDRSLNELDEELTSLDGKSRETAQRLAGLKASMEELDQAIKNADRNIEAQQRRREDFEGLRAAYEVYLTYREELARCKKEAERLQERQGLSQSQHDKLQERLRTLETEGEEIGRGARLLEESLQRYASYEEALASGETVPPGSAEEMEAKYKAITSAMSQEIHELEEQEARASKRFLSSSEELSRLQQKYGLKSGTWRDTRYSRREESHQEVLLEDKRQKIEGKRMLWSEADKKIAVVDQQLRERKKRMQVECGQDTPLPQAEIQDQDFDGRKNQLCFREKEAQRQADRLRMRIQSYDENLTALSEYTEFALGEDIAWEQDFAGMDSRELRNFKGILIRDYNQKGRDLQTAKERMLQVLNQILRMEAFQEDFYRKPLEAMLELAHDGSQVLLQLQTTLQSYDSLMEKLEVDISLVEKEKDKIVELLEDYIREVHQNLGRIDHNSTITIREKPVKMLKIQIPEWEENESLYHIRLQDFIDGITQKGIRIFEKNENAQEYFGTRMTTRNLYDTVVGIGNVQIRLYKVEEQREYPITWAEVARNSGGEGFLSAFVILSSLLYYMRKDDSDIFADKNEGKVLVMDNPFAQTNASHLLKPLMDMAKKTNTQLICLTGLGGESIYNRFDNIYVLNLIAASLRNGMQYLKADHLRGNDPETMVVSRIQVVEQQELLF